MALLAEADQRAAALEKQGRRDRQEASALRRTLAGFTQVCRGTAPPASPDTHITW